MEMFYLHKPWIKYISGFRVKAPWQKKKDIQASKMKGNLILNQDAERNVNTEKTETKSGSLIENDYTYWSCLAGESKHG